MARVVDRVEGRGCVLRGNDVDTDRIIPARYLRCVTFDDLGEHAFKDDRVHAKGDHPLDQEHFEDARILIVGHNFGSGSSREHAPQALMRWGFEAFVGGSFAEIFLGNCTALGLPCVTLADDERAALKDSVELDPGQELSLDIGAATLTSRLGTMSVGIPDGVQRQLLEGTWDATGMLLDAGDAIEATARALPYINGF